MDLNVNKALPASGVPSSRPINVPTPPASSEPSSPPRRTLFTSIGEALRSVRFGKQPVSHTMRPLQSGEEHALISFERHARDCPTCSNIHKVYVEGHNLCSDGYGLGQLVLQYLYMEADQSVYSTNLDGGRRVRVEIPTEFPFSWELLETVERSFRHANRGQPFVSPNQPWPGPGDQRLRPEALPPGVTVYEADVTLPVITEAEKATAAVHVWSDTGNLWEPLQQSQCSIYLFPGRVRVFARDPETEIHPPAPQLSLELTPQVLIERSTSSDITVDRARTFSESVVKSASKFLFTCEGPMECEMLFQRLKHMAQNSPKHSEQQSEQELSEFVQPRTGVVPDEFWVCGKCNAGHLTHLIHKTCAACGHPRDHCCVGPGERFPRPTEPPTSNESTSLSPPSTGFRRKSDTGLTKIRGSGHSSIGQGASATMIEEEGAFDLDSSDAMRVRGPALTLLGQRVLAYLRALPQTNAGLYTHDLAAALDADVADIERVTEHLKALNLIHPVFGHIQAWAATDKPDSLPALTQQPSYRESKHIHDEEEPSESESEPNLSPELPPSQGVDVLLSDLSNIDITRRSRRSFEEHRHLALPSPPAGAASDIEPRGLSTSNIHKYFRYFDPAADISPHHPDFHSSAPSSAASGARWTIIDRRLVSAKVLKDAGEQFADTDAGFLVRRILTKEEILGYAEKTGQRSHQRERSSSPTPAPQTKESKQDIDLSTPELSTINLGDYVTYVDRPGERPPSEARSRERRTSTGVSSSYDRPALAGYADALRNPDRGHLASLLMSPDPHWTKIDRRLVNSQALEEANEQFRYGKDEQTIIVHRMLTPAAIMKLAERTREIRRGKDEWGAVAERALEAGSRSKPEDGNALKDQGTVGQEKKEDQLKAEVEKDLSEADFGSRTIESALGSEKALERQGISGLSTINISDYATYLDSPIQLHHAEPRRGGPSSRRLSTGYFDPSDSSGLAAASQSETAYPEARIRNVHARRSSPDSFDDALGYSAPYSGEPGTDPASSGHRAMSPSREEHVPRMPDIERTRPPPSHSSGGTDIRAVRQRERELEEEEDEHVVVRRIHRPLSSTPEFGRWTQIDRKFVSRRALQEAGETFDEVDDSLVVHRGLTSEELMKLAERTKEIRSGARGRWG